MNNKLSNCSLLAGALLIGVSHANAAASYTYTDLGRGGASGINNAGQVVGYSGNNAVVWNGTTVTILASGLGVDGASVFAINNAGQVAGSIGNQSVVWNGTTPTILGIGSGLAINNVGQVAGTSGANGDRATVWTMTGTGITTTDLGYGQASAINDAGQVAGSSYLTGNGTVWNMTGHGTTVTDLGVNPLSINNAGQIAGIVPGPYDTIAARWAITNNVVTTSILAGLYADAKTILAGVSANAINNAGLVVGEGFQSTESSRDSDGFYNPLFSNNLVIALLWNGTEATDLNSFLTADKVSAGWTLRSAYGINDSGSIVGQSYNTLTYAYDAFLLTPNVSVDAVPEPETYALMLGGLGALGFMARHRKSPKYSESQACPTGESFGILIPIRG